MFRTLITLTLAAVVMLTAGTAMAQVTVTLFNEDFEGGAGDLTGGGFDGGTGNSWSDNGDPSMQITNTVGTGTSLTTGIVGNGVEGNAHRNLTTPAGGNSNTARNFNIASIKIQHPLDHYDTYGAAAKTYQLSWDGMVHDGSNSWGTTHGGVYVGANQAYDETAFGIRHSRSDTNGFMFDSQGDGTTGSEKSNGSASLNGGNPNYFGQSEIELSVTFDLQANTIAASVARVDGGGASGPINFTTVAFDPNELQSIARDAFYLTIINDVYAADIIPNDYGMDVDNLLVTQTIPEPATLGLALLGLVGLAMRRRRR